MNEIEYDTLYPQRELKCKLEPPCYRSIYGTACSSLYREIARQRAGRDISSAIVINSAWLVVMVVVVVVVVVKVVAGVVMMMVVVVVVMMAKV